ncbi:putative molluscan insulin-related peptide(s) receptor [Aricia agestis]|uniref:putative molluscan insulin-related peptide(s) receptor n=1 Tax=Aricia agestis TaxID=91739 RepID=UPI001C208B19|nr:putative molluscan insulin-related peptide(s) receptor [Aricia agestis]
MALPVILFTFVVFLSTSSSTRTLEFEQNGFCTTMHCNTIAKLKNLENCTIIVGDLKILLLERAKSKDFTNISFPKLKEVTGFMVVYRVAGLDTFGRMFPNLARIRGTHLLYNYALIVYDLPNLTEVGFYNLLKVDRGGVIIWGGPLTCNVDTIDWSHIAPRARHVISSPDQNTCSVMCTCSTNPATNRCWNNRKCQRFLDGPDGEHCSDQCLGCRKTNPNSCTLCREYTDGDACVPQCPSNKLVLSVSNYCINKSDCEFLGRFAWDGRCVSGCPENYVKKNNSGTVTCVRCDDCKKTCGNLTLQTLASIQDAEKCVYVNGSLTIRVWSIPNVANELRFYLKNIVEVSDYILIYGSMTLTSLHFLSSLRRVRGIRLYGKRYSVVVHDMHNLQTLLLSNVTEKLNIENGTLRLYRNPMLCRKQIEKLRAAFRETPDELDVPQGMNGYSGSCREVSLGLKIRATNETSAVATFYPNAKADSNYTILYVRVPHGINASIVPETCSEFEWNAISVNVTTQSLVKVQLMNLLPASTYVACIETYESSSRFLARSSVVNFSTPVGKPEPPFILELTASFSDAIVIRWVNHLDFNPFIDHYELDVRIVDISDVDVIYKGNCLFPDNNMIEIDYTRHAKVRRPPRKYEKSCESMCGVLSTVTVGAMVEDYFDVCGAIEGCGDNEYINRPNNITRGGIVHSTSLNLTAPLNNTQISGLAPFRDYRFELRACTKELCSRTVREFVRTLRTKSVDVATIKSVSANTLGYVTVEWEPPKRINGPILCYNLEIYPGIKINNNSRTLPQVTCVASNVTNIVVKTIQAKKYVVKICTTTLGSSYLCTDVVKVDVIEDIPSKTLSTWLTGIFIGVGIYFASVFFGWKYGFREVRTDDIPLVDATSEYRNESEPPAVMLSDFAPIYSVPYRELR